MCARGEWVAAATRWLFFRRACKPPPRAAARPLRSPLRPYSARRAMPFPWRMDAPRRTAALTGRVFDKQLPARPPRWLSNTDRWFSLSALLCIDRASHELTLCIAFIHLCMIAANGLPRRRDGGCSVVHASLHRAQPLFPPLPRAPIQRASRDALSVAHGRSAANNCAYRTLL